MHFNRHFLVATLGSLTVSLFAHGLAYGQILNGGFESGFSSWSVNSLGNGNTSFAVVLNPLGGSQGTRHAQLWAWTNDLPRFGMFTSPHAAIFQNFTATNAGDAILYDLGQTVTDSNFLGGAAVYLRDPTFPFSNPFDDPRGENTMSNGGEIAYGTYIQWVFGGPRPGTSFETVVLPIPANRIGVPTQFVAWVSADHFEAAFTTVLNIDNVRLASQGDEPLYPILPSEPTPGGGFQFNNVPGTGRWFDPTPVESFLFQTDGLSNFTKVSLPSGLGDADGLYTIAGSFGSITLAEGSQYMFPSPLTSFTISGILPLVDGEDPLAFPTFLQFDQQTVNFTMTPVVEVPEPSSLVLCGLGMFGLVRLRRRRV